MRIAVDVCMGSAGSNLLRWFGHKVLEAEHGERDYDWLERARVFGVELLVSGDSDVEIYAYDNRIPYVRARKGENGTKLAQRVLNGIARKTRAQASL